MSEITQTMIDRARAVRKQLRAAANRADAAEMQRDQLLAALETIADGSARNTPKNDKCAHGQYSFQPCDQCIEDFARAAIAEASSANGKESIVKKTGAAELDSFSQGVLYAASLLVAIHDQPTMAASVLREAGLNDADCSELDDFEKRNLRRIQGEKAIALRGL